MNLYIFDLDMTLALIGHRRRFLTGDAGSLQAYYDAIVDDEPNEMVIKLLQDLAYDNEVWIVTSRSARCREQTETWLATHCRLRGAKLDRMLFMRPTDEPLSGAAWKYKFLAAMSIADRDRLVACFDDDDEHVEMYRGNGVTCFQLAHVL